MVKIVLKSNDDELFEVDRNIIRLSTTLNTMFQDLGVDDLDATNMLNDPIPLPKVNGKILSKLLQWCEYHKNDIILTEKELEENNLKTDNISYWDVDFLNMDLDMLFELILAANYLDIRGLLDVSSKTVANMIKGKTPEQIRQIFNIQNDFTPEEEEQIRRESAWSDYEGM